MKMELSYKYGFLGLGLGGTSIAAACADSTDGTNHFPYSALLINTNKVDLDKVQIKNPKTVKKLIGNGKGAGRDISVGEAIFVEHKDEIFSLMDKHLSNTDFIWISAGLGGGSGTGAVIQAIGLCLQMKKRFGLILTLPRLNERSTVNSNALKRLNKIYQALNQLGPVIIVDNEKLFNEFMTEHPKASLEEYLKYSNEFVANAIHDKNIVTANFDVYGATNFDSSELGKMLLTPGVLHFARLEMNVEELKELDTLATMQDQKAKFIELLELQIKKGVLSTGFDFKKTKRAAISVLAPETEAKNIYGGTMTKQLEQLLIDVAPNATESPVSFHTYTEKQEKNATRTVYFYIILAGLDLPEERIKQMIDLDKEAVALTNIPSKNLFEDYKETTFTPQSIETFATIDSLFGSSKKETENTKEDLFEKLGLV